MPAQSVAVGTLVALLVLSSHLASAGSGVYVSTDKPSYSYLSTAGLSSVKMTIHNNLPSSIFLPNPLSFNITDDRTTVYAPGAVQIFVEIPPGGSYQKTWDLSTACTPWVPTDLSCYGLATPGAFSANWFYSQSPSITSLDLASVSFNLSGVPP